MHKIAWSYLLHTKLISPPPANPLVMWLITSQISLSE